jgi:hypothetical protein
MAVPSDDIFNNAFNSSPQGSDSISTADDAIRKTREATGQNLGQEHAVKAVMPSSTDEQQGEHLQGSAKAYYGMSDPTTLPGGAAIPENDQASFENGRISAIRSKEIAQTYPAGAAADTFGQFNEAINIPAGADAVGAGECMYELRVLTKDGWKSIGMFTDPTTFKDFVRFVAQVVFESEVMFKDRIIGEQVDCTGLRIGSGNPVITGLGVQ